MTIKIRFDRKTINKRNIKVVKTPNENDEHVVTYINKKNQRVFLLPIIVDVKSTIQNGFKFELDVVKPDNVVSDSLVSLEGLQPNKRQLDKLGLLPGQVNEKSSTMKRVKKRMQEKELSESFRRSGSEKDLKIEYDRYGKNKMINRQNRKKKAMQNNKNLLRNIHNGDKQKLDALKINQTNKVKKIKIDVTRKVSNKFAKNIKKGNISDQKAFGTKNKFVLGNPNNPGVNNSSPIFTTNVDIENNFEAAASLNKNEILTNDSNTSNISPGSKSVQRTISRLYMKTIDPAVAFEGIPTHRTVKHQKRGTRPKIGVKSTGKKKNILKDFNISKSLKLGTLDESIRVVRDVMGPNQLKIKGGKAGPGSFDTNFSKDRVNHSFPFVYPKKVIDKDKIVYLKYVHNSLYMHENKVNFILSIRNPKGLIVVKKRFTLDVINILDKQTRVINNIPRLKVINSRNTSYARIEVTNGSNRAIRYKIYRKVMSPIKNSIEAEFEEMTEGSVKAGGIDRKKVKQSHQVDCLYRMTFTVSGEVNNLVYSNFSNDVTLSKIPGRSTRNISIIARTLLEDNRNRGITVDVTNLPADTESVKLLRKRTCLVNNPNNRIRKAEYVLERNPGNDELIVSAREMNDLGAVRFLDVNVLDDTNYEYQAEILLTRGTKHVPPKKARETFNESESLTIAKFFDTPEKLGNSGYQNQNMQILSLEGNKTIADTIIDNLSKKPGIPDIFKEDIQKIKVATNVTKRASISLINKTTGDIDYIGDFENGAEIKKPKILTKNCEYTFRVEPYEYSPIEVIDNLAKILESGKNLQEKEIAPKFSALKRSALTNIKKTNKRTLKKNRSKYFSRRRLKKGSIEPPDRSISIAKSRPKMDFFDVEKSGDTVYVDFDNFANRNFNITGKDFYVAPDHKVIVTFNVLGDIDDIDFYIITSKKEGNFFPVGSAHCDKVSKTINYLDYVNCDYLGVVDYYVQAVYEDGSISDRKNIGKVALINKFDQHNLMKDARKGEGYA